MTKFLVGDVVKLSDVVDGVGVWFMRLQDVDFMDADASIASAGSVCLLDPECFTLLWDRDESEET